MRFLGLQLEDRVPYVFNQTLVFYAKRHFYKDALGRKSARMLKLQDCHRPSSRHAG